jgi:lysophospholipase L1-like esterase
LRLDGNLAVNGFTSRGVIEHELPALASLKPGFISLLVGVNDVVQDVSTVTFRVNAAVILDALVAAVSPGRVVVVSMPDYTLTPEGAAYGDPDQRRQSIVEFNGVMVDAAGDRGVAFVDIFEVSRRVQDDPALVAPDGLHPSAAQYRLWVDRIAPVVERLLRE